MSGPKFKEPKADEFLHRDTFWTDICEWEQKFRYQESDVSMTYEISTSGGPLQIEVYASGDWIQACLIKNIKVDVQTRVSKKRHNITKIRFMPAHGTMGPMSGIMIAMKIWPIVQEDHGQNRITTRFWCFL